MTDSGPEAVTATVYRRLCAAQQGRLRRTSGGVDTLSNNRSQTRITGVSDLETAGLLVMTPSGKWRTTAEGDQAAERYRTAHHAAVTIRAA